MISISARSLLTAALLLNCGVTCAAPYLTVDTSASVGDGYYQTGYDADTVYRAASGPVEVASSTSYSGGGNCVIAGTRTKSEQRRRRSSGSMGLRA